MSCKMDLAAFVWEVIPGIGRRQPQSSIGGGVHDQKRVVFLMVVGVVEQMLSNIRRNSSWASVRLRVAHFWPGTRRSGPANRGARRDAVNAPTTQAVESPNGQGVRRLRVISGGMRYYSIVNTLTVKIPPALEHELLQLSEQAHISKSELVRRALAADMARRKSATPFVSALDQAGDVVGCFAGALRV